MIRKALIIGAVIVAGLASAVPAGAAREDLAFVCDGVPTNINVAGGSRIGTIDGVKYKAVVLYFEDTEGILRYAKSYGNTGRQLSGESITCTQTDDTGTFTVVAVPA